MSKHWRPSKATVPLNAAQPAVKPSRIRREPVRLQAVVKAEPVSREREIAGGVVGILLVAAALVTAIIGISAATLFRDDPNAAAEAARFGQCYNAGGPNCVVDAQTIYVQRQRVAIAGMETPAIQSAACDDERTQGIEAAVRLAELLNGGRVSVGPMFVDEAGREVRSVTVNGNDVAKQMIKEGSARKAGKPTNWCAPDGSSAGVSNPA